MYFDNCTTIEELRNARNELIREFHPDANGNVDNSEIREINIEFTKRSAEITLQEEAEQNTDVISTVVKALAVKGVEAAYKRNPNTVKKINDLLGKNIAEGLNDGINGVINLLKKI